MTENEQQLFIRSLLASAALSGLLSNSNGIDWNNSKEPAHEIIANQAVKYGDAVWNELWGRRRND